MHRLPAFVRYCYLKLGFVASILCTCPVLGQDFGYGPQHSGLAHATLALPSPVAGPNPVVVNRSGQVLLSLHTARLYNVRALTRNSLSTTLSARQLDITMRASSMRFDAYRQLLTETALSHPIRAGTRRTMFASLRVTSQHVGINSYGRASNYALSAGLLAPVIHNVFLGLSVRHLLQTNSRLYLPRQVGVGIAAQLRAGFWIMGARYQEPGYQPAFHAGLLIVLQHVLHLRFGFTTNPARWASGFGLQMAFIEFHAAVTQHVLLGWTPELSINLRLTRQKAP